MEPCIPTTAAAGVIFAALATLVILVMWLFWDVTGVRGFLDGGDDTNVVEGGCMDDMWVEPTDSVSPITSEYGRLLALESAAVDAAVERAWEELAMEVVVVDIVVGCAGVGLVMEVVVVAALDGPAAASKRSLSGLAMEGAVPPGWKTWRPLAPPNGMMACIFS
jgi:hypothetical protein